MKMLAHFGLVGVLLLGVASACSDDDVAPSGGGAGAAGEAGYAGAASEPGAAGTPGAGGDASGGAGEGALASFTVLNVNELKNDPERYDWFDFRPNVQKLILAGEAETEHIAILWYTVADGGVGLHYHSKTESVYVIDGTQTDAKGVYENGTVYFNPPGSGHQITDSSGFFILAYAAPPDFASTALIGEYSPVRIDTTASDLTTAYDFVERADGVLSHRVPLAEEGGLSAELLSTTSSTPYTLEGNYLLVLEGSCDIEGVTFEQGTLVVARGVAPQAYSVNAAENATCLTLHVSF
jgi:ChrR Cupin-like domain